MQPEEGQLRGLNPPIGEHTLGLWLHYTLSALRDTRGFVREVFSYEGVLSDSENSVRRLAQKILPTAPSEEQVRNAIASVKPEWSHNRYSREDLDAWPSLVAHTYDCCLRIDQDSDGFNGGKYDAELDSLWDEFALMGRMVRPIQLPSGQMLLSWRQGDRTAMHAHKYSPTGSWQTLKIAVTVPGGSTIQLDPYQMPSQLWIKRAIWRNASGEHRATLSPGPGGVLEDAFGVKKLTVFGPGSLYAQTPAGGPSNEFEIEFQIQSGQAVMNNIVGMLRGGIDQVRRGMPR